MANRLTSNEINGDICISNSSLEHGKITKLLLGDKFVVNLSAYNNQSYLSGKIFYHVVSVLCVYAGTHVGILMNF